MAIPPQDHTSKRERESERDKGRNQRASAAKSNEYLLVAINTICHEVMK